MCSPSAGLLLSPTLPSHTPSPTLHNYKHAVNPTGAACAGLKTLFVTVPPPAPRRAENSYTHRHLCEFTGLDFEMAIAESYHEVLDVLDRLFVYMFQVGRGSFFLSFFLFFFFFFFFWW